MLVSCLLAAGVALGAATATGVNPVSAEDHSRPQLRAGLLSGEIQLDGRLDEPAWHAADAIAALVMVEPRQGDLASGVTTVKVIAGPGAILFGVRCQDPDPSGIVSFTKERDGDLDAEDHVVLLLDPFLDGRSGYVFAVNPGGARFDALVEPGGEDVEEKWDGEWEAAVSRDANGWAAEIRVPIETLSFKKGLHEWGFNVQRRIQRLLETDRWASPLQDHSVFQPNLAGRLVGLPAFDLGRGLSVRPALVGGYRRPAAGARAEGTLDPSLDVTQRVGSNMLASLSVNTDFAETEVDSRRTNLTRFPLFFPEKRSFFLDGADIFTFGIGLGEESLLPFHTRRIGLVDQEEVPILAGLKLTGRLGQTSLGALAVRTREAAEVAPATTLGVLRLQQNVLAESRVGLLGTVGDPLGRPGSWELGLDFTYRTSRFRGDKNFAAGVWGLATGRDDLQRFRERTAFGLKVDYPNDLWDCLAIYRRVGDGFDPSLGFVPRRGVNALVGGCTFAPRLESHGVRQMFFGVQPGLTTDLDGRWESYEVGLTPLDLQMESGDRVVVEITPAGERLAEPFEVADAVVVPAGRYEWRRQRLEIETAPRRRLAAEATWTFGGFYTGTLHQLELDASWTPSPRVTLLLNVEHDVGRLDEGDFDVTLLGGKVRLNLSPNLQLNSFLQYDTEEGALGTNTRLRWTFHPRGDLFIVYNKNIRDVEGRFRSDASELLVKVQRNFRW